jgi:hypothetical protein
VPAAVQGLRSLPLSGEPNVFPELFVDYLGILVAAGGDTPGARQAVVEHLDLGGPTLTKTGSNARRLRVHLLLTLARLGLPAEEGERKTALSRVREGLASDRVEIFSAATKVVAAATLSREEAVPLVEALGGVLEKEGNFQELTREDVRQLSWEFSAEEQQLLGRGLAVRALGALGSGAREALAKVRALAGQRLQNREDYWAEPAINFLIREARKAEKQIEGMR